MKIKYKEKDMEYDILIKIQIYIGYKPPLEKTQTQLGWIDGRTNRWPCVGLAENSTAICGA